MRPALILVTGPAGSGKTTLAHELATVLGCPAICRDEIKEGMVATDPGFVATESDLLTAATYDVFFDAITLLLRSDVTLVAEAAFQHGLWWRGLEPLTGLARLKVIRCQVSERIARERVLARTSTQATRVAHADVDHVSTAREFEVIDIDAPTLDVDTSGIRQPSLEDMAAFCRA